jgi:hypothetical protein
MLRIRATNRTIVGYVRYARFSQMQALASLFACGQPAGVHAAGGTVSPRRVPEKKKNPIKSGVPIRDYKKSINLMGTPASGKRLEVQQLRDFCYVK